MRSRRDDSDPDLDRLNAAVVTVPDLWLLHEEARNRAVDLNDWQRRRDLLKDLYPADPVKGQAIDQRFLAMGALVGSGKLKGWTRPSDNEGALTVTDAVWAAAAQQPLIFNRYGLPEFNDDSFLAKVLELSPDEGRA